MATNISAVLIGDGIVHLKCAAYFAGVMALGGRRSRCHRGPRRLFDGTATSADFKKRGRHSRATAAKMTTAAVA